MYITHEEGAQNLPDAVFSSRYLKTWSWDSIVDIVTGYGLDSQRVSLSPGRVKIFSSPHCTDQLWGPPRHLSSGYCGLFSGGKVAGA
jgi:hypothetical protein